MKTQLELYALGLGNVAALTIGSHIVVVRIDGKPHQLGPEYDHLEDAVNAANSQNVTTEPAQVYDHNGRKTHPLKEL